MALPVRVTSTLDRPKIWRVLRAAASVFAASERRVIAGSADLLVSRSPRFVTNPSCNPTVSEVPVPAAWFASGNISDLWTWLRGKGYDDSNRKHFEFTQHSLAAGPASTEAYYDLNQPDPAHQAGEHALLPGHDRRLELEVHRRVEHGRRGGPRDG